MTSARRLRRTRDSRQPPASRPLPYTLNSHGDVVDYEPVDVDLDVATAQPRGQLALWGAR